jgi:delta-lactam-biosynthetic de-N-acetylase
MDLSRERIPLNTEIRLSIFFIIIFCLFFSFSFSGRQKPQSISIPKILEKSEIVRCDTSKKQIIFTFDGGSEAVSGSKILDVMNKYHIKTSFFLTGKFVQNNPDLVLRMYKEGHEIYNHTLDHPHLTEVSDQEIKRQLEGMDELLQKITGESSRPFFRPPYGDRDERVINVAHSIGFRSVYWTHDALDWQESSGITATEVRERILGTLAPGNIYLIHVGDTISGNILEDLILEINKRGYKIVSLEQGL